jgi:protein-disulfide isomerase
MIQLRNSRTMLALATALLALGAAFFFFRVHPAPVAAQGTSDPARQGATAVVAEIDGQPIQLGELERALGPALDRLQQQMYEMKRQKLDEMIGERLLEREAVARGTTVEALMQSEVFGKAGAVTDADVDRFYEQNRARLPDQPNIMDQIRTYLQQQRLAAQRETFVASLREKGKVVVSLEPPPVTRYDVRTEGAPFRGPADAPVTIVEFSDFHCPFCRRVKPTLAELLKRYPKEVRLVYRDLPLDSLHPEARRASEAARCAHDQGQFWAYHDELYNRGPDASPAALAAVAQTVGLDLPVFEQCLASGTHREAVQRDVDEATSLGANGTPAFFVNGRLLSGAQPLEAFVAVIEQELQTTGQSEPATR